MKAMLLAAGRGKRMMPLTATTPKPLLTVAGKPLIVWHIERLAAAGVQDIVINHAWLGTQFPATLGDGSAFGVRLHYSAEDEALETAGGIIQALPMLGNAPFIVISSDVWSDYDPACLLQPGDTSCLAHLVMVPNAAHHPTGDFCLQSGRLRLADASSQDTLTYAGIGRYHPDFFAGQPAGHCPLRPLLEAAIRADRVSAECHRGQWHDIGTPARLQALDHELRQRQE